MIHLHLLLTIVMGALLASCSFSPDDTQEDSEVNGFKQSQLKANFQGSQHKALQATKLLKNNGWCKINKKYLPKGWTHNQLVRQMACIANKESTFGRYPTGPLGGAGRCGTPYGYWQVAQCHIGKSRGGYSCPNVTIATLRDNPDISAKCSLYVYMDRALSGRSGLGPWEATCTSSERDAKLANGQFIFPSNCEDYTKVCKESMTTSFLPDGKAKIEVSAKCPATKIEYWLLGSSNPKEEITKTKLALLKQSGEKKQVIIDLKAASLNSQLDDFDLIRIAFKKNSTLYYQTNPSIPIP